MTEAQLQIAVCNYIRLQYPNVIFWSDLSGVYMSKAASGMAKAMRSSRSIPDLFIAHPIHPHNGMFLELKTETPFKKDGSLKRQMKPIKDRRGRKIGEYNHLQDQLEMLNKLTDLGYFASFGVGFDECCDIIDRYMKREIK